MRTFVLRSRKGSVSAGKLEAQVGSGAHSEVIAHTIANAFYISNAMRDDVEVYVVLDSSPDFPRTLRLSSAEGLSFPGFHEAAILGVLSDALSKGSKVAKDESVSLMPGIEMLGFGFDRLVQRLLETRKVYLLEPRAVDIRSADISADAVFVLSDHIPMPPKSLKGLERKGAEYVSLGPKMLFASQCVTLVHDELDRRGA